MNRTTIKKIGSRGLRRDGGVLDTNLDHETEIKCKIVVLGLLGLDWGGDCVEDTGVEFTEINRIFCGCFYGITRSNLNFNYSLGLIVKLSAEYGKRFLHFLTKTGPCISKKLQLHWCFRT